jgi:phage terminase small subunit
MPRPLTPEQERFVEEYIIDNNATRAYKAAYPDADYPSCRARGSALRAKVNIKAEIAARRQAQQNRTRMRADTALREAGRLAYSDPLYLFEDDGVTLRNIRAIPVDTRRAIAEIKTRRERVEKRPAGTITADCPECGFAHDVPAEVHVTYDTIAYKLWPKPKGLDKVFAHLGLQTEITPLDALLAALPTGLAAQVRAALAGALPGGDGASGAGG